MGHFWFLAYLLVSSTAMATGNNTTGSSWAGTPQGQQKPEAPKKDPYGISDCGQRCAFQTTAEMLTYYFVYASKDLEFTDPQALQDTKDAVNDCLRANTSRCTEEKRKLLVKRVTQYNYYRDLKRKILEAQTNAKNLESVNLMKPGKNGFDSRIATQGDVKMLQRMLAKIPMGRAQALTKGQKTLLDPTRELDPDEKRPFKIDPNQLRRETDESVAFGGRFKSEYDTILASYTRPQFGSRTGLTTIYTNDVAAGYAKAKNVRNAAGDKFDVQETTQAGRSQAAVVDMQHYAADTMSQDSAQMRLARKEFEESHQNRNLVAKRVTDSKGKPAVDTNFTEIGVDDLGLRPHQYLDSVEQNKAVVKEINKEIDEGIAEEKNKAAKKNEKVVVNTYDLSMDKFDQFLDNLWPTGAKKN